MGDAGRDRGRKGRDKRQGSPSRTPPPHSPRVARSLEEKLDALDDHLYLLRVNLFDHERGETAHLRVIAAELRVLVCESDRTEGLIWRMADEMEVSDAVRLDLPPRAGKARPDVVMAYIPLTRPGRQSAPVLDFLVRDDYSLKEVIKERTAVYPGPEPLTYEAVIKFVAQQIGTAHESDDIRADLARLRSFFLASRGLHDDILCQVAGLALEVGRRVLDEAARSRGYRLKPRIRAIGEATGADEGADPRPGP